MKILDVAWRGRCPYREFYPVDSVLDLASVDGDDRAHPTCLAVVTSLFKSRARVEVENTALPQQLIVLRRKLPGRVRLTNGDRTFFVWLYRLFSSALGVNPTRFSVRTGSCSH